MITLDEAEARRLIVSGAAGYYSIHSRTIPIEHADQTVIHVQGWFLLAPADQFRVRFVGPVGHVAGRAKGAWSIECNDDEIAGLVQQEMVRRGVPFSHHDEGHGHG